jgi:hypothetical protein
MSKTFDDEIDDKIEKVLKFPSVKPVKDFVQFAEEIARARQQADDNVEAWQAEITIGDHFIRVHGAIMIYGKVIDLDYEEDRELYKEPHMKNVRFTKCYSKLCPDGELGNTHVATMAFKMTAEQFENAREAKWPVDIRAVYALLNIVPGGEA